MSYNSSMGKKSAKPSGKIAMPPFMAASDKRSLILRAAQKLFPRDGFSDTSMDAITHEAGVSKATVYAHFESKDKLFEALIRVGSDATLNAMPTLVRNGGDPRSELLGFFEPFLQLLFGSGAYSWERMIIAEARRHPENAKLFFECTVERITKWVELYLLDLSKDGLFAKKNTRLSAEALVSIVLLGPLHRALLVGPNMVDVKRSLDFGVNLLLRESTGP